VLYSPTVRLDPNGEPILDQYTTLSGTSMATPAVCGIGALLSRFASKHLQRTLFADEMKAVLVHTAMSPLEGPSYQIGWGSIRADRAGALIASEGGMLVRDKLHQQKFVWKGSSKGGKAIRVTLVWLDPEGKGNTKGLDDPTPVIVHNLDLTLSPASGVKRFPWSLDPKDPSATATRNVVNKVDKDPCGPSE
jgi:hypothetical protein